MTKERNSLISERGSFKSERGSFWDLGNYRRATKRIEDGFKLCTDFQMFIDERAEIEEMYAKKLRTWSKKWKELIEKGPEYGTMETAFKGLLTEANRVGAYHMHIKEHLCNNEIEQIKTWQKDNYHKHMSHIKERKDMDDQFKRAQTQWIQLSKNVECTKSEFYEALKNEKTSEIEEQTATVNNFMPSNQVKEMHDNLQKAKVGEQKYREEYERALQELNHYKPIYKKNMISLFDKCQKMEEIRMRFFKRVLYSLHKTLDVTRYPDLPEIYQDLYHTIDNVDPQKDMELWSKTHGFNMDADWPAFLERFSEHFDGASTSTAV